MPLRLTYQSDTTIPVEVEGLLPRSVRELSLPQIERYEIFHGNEKRPLADQFACSNVGILCVRPKRSRKRADDEAERYIFW